MIRKIFYENIIHYNTLRIQKTKEWLHLIHCPVDDLPYPSLHSEQRGDCLYPLLQIFIHLPSSDS